MAIEKAKAPKMSPESPEAEAPVIPQVATQVDTELQQDATTPAARTEHGGQTGPEPTRYGDWEKNGRCTDF